MAQSGIPRNARRLMSIGNELREVDGELKTAFTLYLEPSGTELEVDALYRMLGGLGEKLELLARELKDWTG